MFGKMGDMMGKLQEMKKKADEIKIKLDNTVLHAEGAETSKLKSRATVK